LFREVVMLHRLLSTSVLVFLTAAPAFAEGGPPGATSTAAIFTTDGRIPGRGTGVLIDRERRWLLTSWHVVRDKTEIVVQFPRFEKGAIVTNPTPYFEARCRKEAPRGQIVAIDAGRDLAIIEVDALPSDAVAVPLADAPPTVREPVTLLGQPLESNVLWDGRSGTALRCGRKAWTYPDGRTIEAGVLEVFLSEPLSSGFSGGPVFNRKKQLAAVVVAAKVEGSCIIYSVEVGELRDLIAAAHRGRSWSALRQGNAAAAAREGTASLTVAPRQPFAEYYAWGVFACRAVAAAP
jgi:S1-C subfamily serine protease